MSPDFSPRPATPGVSVATALAAAFDPARPTRPAHPGHLSARR